MILNFVKPLKLLAGASVKGSVTSTSVHDELSGLWWGSPVHTWKIMSLFSQLSFPDPPYGTCTCIGIGSKLRVGGGERAIVYSKCTKNLRPRPIPHASKGVYSVLARSP